MVVEHQQNSGGNQEQEGAERQCAQIPGRAEAEHASAHLRGEQVQKDVLLDCQRAVQRAGSGTAAENRTPNSACAQLLEVVRYVHLQTLTNCMGRTSVERSTMRSPSSLIHMCFQGSGLGAGPSIFSPF